ncbi:MAG: dimethyl sulfoxide reductase anchor subunit [Burkholderiales bacterium]|nr:MAG: dimethyl sulfoxide reductase anchor subunit [Burkholderiales bacterium]
MIDDRMAGDSFRLGFRFQRHWDTPMAGAFFCGEVGAGLFLVSMLFGQLPGMLAGLAIATLGKGILHLAHMGLPGRSWRAILRPDRSWVSRGLIAIVVLAASGTLHVAHVLGGGGDWLGTALGTMAGAAAVLVMTYQGFAMSHSAAIGLWSTAMMPFASLLYAATSGVVLTLLLHRLPESAPADDTLVAAAMVLLPALLIMLASMLHAAYHGSPGARLSAELLMRGRYAAAFHGTVLAIGLIVPLAALALGADSTFARLLAAAGVLTGFYAFRVLVFKAGVYEPVMSF